MTGPINSSNATFSAFIQAETPNVEAQQSGVTGKAKPGTAIHEMKGVLSALANNFAGRAALGVSADGKPELAQPKANLNDIGALKASLNQEINLLETEPAYAARANQFFEQLEQDCQVAIEAARTEAKAPARSHSDFDINDMKSFSPVELIMMLLHLLNTLRTTDAALSAKMTLNAAESVNKSTDALKQQGYTQMVGAIAGATVGLALSGAGIAIGALASLKTYRNEKLNMGAVNDNKGQTAKLNDALGGVKPGKVGAETTQLNVKKNDGNKTVKLQESDQKLDDASKRIIDDKSTGDQHEINAERHSADAANKLDIAKLSAGSSVLNVLGTSASNLAGNVANNDVVKDRVEQQLEEQITKNSNEIRQQAEAGKDSTNGVASNLLAAAKQLQEAITAGRSTQAGGTRV
ncbi:MAG TPA: IpaC/SipC family type III secretion system effector [Herbaspirillum sp.]